MVAYVFDHVCVSTVKANDNKWTHIDHIYVIGHIISTAFKWQLAVISIISMHGLEMKRIIETSVIRVTNTV